MFLLNLFLLCQDWGAMPEPGGLLDQDSLVVYYMEAFTTGKAERKKFEDDELARRMSKASGR